MTRDDIIRMAREAGFVVDEADFITAPKTGRTGFQLELEHFAALAAAAEREECASLLENGVDLSNLASDPSLMKFVRDVLLGCAALIRSRGEQHGA